MSEGYGYNFMIWDLLVKGKFEEQLKKLGAPKYNNWEVFKSPKGRWMAFHTADYGDLRIVDLETLETVLDTFYTKRVYKADGSYDRENSFYGEHVNYSTFVPTYQITRTESRMRPGTIFHNCLDMMGLTATDIAKWFDWDHLFSVPIAFNAWTLWAADFEFYVDIIDLSRVDEGIIKQYVDKQYTIPREANKVRNYVKFNMDYTLDMKQSEPGVFKPTGTTSAERGEYLIDFSVLEEKSIGRKEVNITTGKHEFATLGGDPILLADDPPWVDLKRRILDYRKNQQEKEK